MIQIEYLSEHLFIFYIIFLTGKLIDKYLFNGSA